MSATVVAPSSPPPPPPSLRALSIRAGHNKVLTSLYCKGSGTCRARLTFAVDLEREFGRRHRHGAVVVARATRALAGGRRIVVTLGLGDWVAHLRRPVYIVATVTGDGARITRAIVMR
jgi:hypothetical protein